MISRYKLVAFLLALLFLLYPLRAKIVWTYITLNFGQIAYVLAESQDEEKSLKKASEWFHVPVEQRYELGGRTLARARVLIIESRYDEARKILSTCSSRYCPLFTYYSCISYFQDGLYQEASNCWREIGVTSKHLIGQASDEDYERWYETALLIEPSSSLHYQLGLKQRGNGLFDESTEAFTKAVELDSDWYSDDQQFSAHYLKALDMYLQRQSLSPLMAQNAASAALDAAPQGVDPEYLANLYGFLAQMAMEDEDYEAAVTYFKAIVEITPVPRHYLSLATATVRNKGEIGEEALVYFNEAARLSDSPSLLEEIKRRVLLTERTQTIICNESENSYAQLREILCP